MPTAAISPARARQAPAVCRAGGAPPAAPRLRVAPAAPIERIDPLLPIDRIEPLEPIDRIDPDDAMEATEPTDRAEPSDSAEPTDAADRADPKQRQDSTDHAERDDRNATTLPPYRWGDNRADASPASHRFQRCAAPEAHRSEDVMGTIVTVSPTTSTRTAQPRRQSPMPGECPEGEGQTRQRPMRRLRTP
jgi:hypothetical protein